MTGPGTPRERIDEPRRPDYTATCILRIVAPKVFLPQRLAMFRWPDKWITVALAYGLVFVGFPALCYLSYLWVRGAI